MLGPRLISSMFLVINRQTSVKIIPGNFTSFFHLSEKLPHTSVFFLIFLIKCGTLHASHFCLNLICLQCFVKQADR